MSTVNPSIPTDLRQLNQLPVEKIQATNAAAEMAMHRDNLVTWGALAAGGGSLAMLAYALSRQTEADRKAAQLKRKRFDALFETSTPLAKLSEATLTVPTPDPASLPGGYVDTGLAVFKNLFTSLGTLSTTEPGDRGVMGLVGRAYGPAVAAAALGIPLGALAAYNFKRMVDRRYRSPSSDKARAAALQREFDTLLAREQMSKTSAAVQSTAAAMESCYGLLTKQADTMYHNLLPILFAATAAATGTYGYQKLRASDPARIKARAAKEAYERSRRERPPTLEAVLVRSPSANKGVDVLDTLDRNMIPIVLPPKLLPPPPEEKEKTRAEINAALEMAKWSSISGSWRQQLPGRLVKDAAAKGLGWNEVRDEWTSWSDEQRTECFDTAMSRQVILDTLNMAKRASADQVADASAAAKTKQANQFRLVANAWKIGTPGQPLTDSEVRQVLKGILDKRPLGNGLMGMFAQPSMDGARDKMLTAFEQHLGTKDPAVISRMMQDSSNSLVMGGLWKEVGNFARGTGDLTSVNPETAAFVKAEAGKYAADPKYHASFATDAKYGLSRAGGYLKNMPAWAMGGALASLLPLLFGSGNTRILGALLAAGFISAPMIMKHYNIDPAKLFGGGAGTPPPGGEAGGQPGAPVNPPAANQVVGQPEEQAPEQAINAAPGFAGYTTPQQTSTPSLNNPQGYDPTAEPAIAPEGGPLSIAPGYDQWNQRDPTSTLSLNSPQNRDPNAPALPTPEPYTKTQPTMSPERGQQLAKGLRGVNEVRMHNEVRTGRSHPSFGFWGNLWDEIVEPMGTAAIRPSAPAVASSAPAPATPATATRPASPTTPVASADRPLTGADVSQLSKFRFTTPGTRA